VRVLGSGRTRRRVVTIVATGAALATLAGCIPVPPRNLSVFNGGSQASTQAFATWLGRTPTVVNDYIPDAGWNDPTPYLHPWQGSPWTMTFGVPMLPPGGTLADGAAGVYDAHFQQLAQKLIDEGLNDAILRIGFEFNGNWFRWRAAADPTSWVAYWQRIVLVMRGVAGTNFKFDWTVLCGTLEIPAPQVWPGDAYVDYIGLNVFDNGAPGYYPIPDGASPADVKNRREHAWDYKLRQSYGLNFWLLYAASHDKYISIPEWGLVDPVFNSGGDNTVFIRSMHDWTEHANVVYQSYFNSDGTLGDSRLMPTTQFPNAAALYQQLFG
jgi:hypothetical protein